MKKLKFLTMLIFAISALFFTSCGDDDEDENPQSTATAFEESTKDVNGTTVKVIEITDRGEGTGNYTMKATDADGNQIHYHLDGRVYVNDGQTLTVEPGAVIKGLSIPSSDNASALIVSRGGKINAVGTKSNPIVMTGTDDPIVTATDEVTVQDINFTQTWGGCILLGRAKTFSDGETELAVEGTPVDDKRNFFGGSDNADNSGTMKYVSIRHTGAEIGPGDEIQGLTLGGVGSGTTIEYVESFASSDDGVEVFGGTVDLKHFVVAYAEDDGYDLDLGWRGKAQYIFQIQRNDGGADQIGEWDGAKPDGAALYSKPDIANATLISTGVGSSSDSYLLVRDGFGGALINSIVVDFPFKAIEVEDLPKDKGVDSYQRLGDDDLNILGNIWHSNTATAVDTAEFIAVTDNAENPGAPTLIDHLTNGNNSLAGTSDKVVTSISRDKGSKGLDPMPNTSSSAWTAEGSSNFAQDVSTYSLPSGIEATTYKGAFDPNGSNWMKDWTALDKYNILVD